MLTPFHPTATCILFCARLCRGRVAAALAFASLQAHSQASSMLSAAGAAASNSVQVGGMAFERQIELAGAKLQLNGAGLRSKAFFKIYASGLYLEQKATTPQAVYAAKGVKRLKVSFLREVDSAGFGKTTSEVMSDNLPRERLGKCIPGIMKLGEIFSAKKKMAVGESYTIDEIPGKGTVVSINGKVAAEIAEPEFFTCLMHNYFGPKPADATLKDALLGKM